MPKRPLRRASDLTKEFLQDPEYAALYLEVANEEVGAAVRSVRETRGLSQRKVADLMGVTRSRISQIESVEGTALALGVLSRYAQAVGCHLNISLRDPAADSDVQVFVPAVPEHDAAVKPVSVKPYKVTTNGNGAFALVARYYSWGQAA